MESLGSSCLSVFSRRPRNWTWKFAASGSARGELAWPRVGTCRSRGRELLRALFEHGVIKFREESWHHCWVFAIWKTNGDPRFIIAARVTNTAFEARASVVLGTGQSFARVSGDTRDPNFVASVDIQVAFHAIGLPEPFHGTRPRRSVIGWLCSCRPPRCCGFLEWSGVHRSRCGAYGLDWSLERVPVGARTHCGKSIGFLCNESIYWFCGIVTNSLLWYARSMWTNLWSCHNKNVWPRDAAEGVECMMRWSKLDCLLTWSLGETGLVFWSREPGLAVGLAVPYCLFMSHLWVGQARAKSAPWSLHYSSSSAEKRSWLQSVRLSSRLWVPIIEELWVWSLWPIVTGRRPCVPRKHCSTLHHGVRQLPRWCQLRWYKTRVTIAIATVPSFDDRGNTLQIISTIHMSRLARSHHHRPFCRPYLRCNPSLT